MVYSLLLFLIFASIASSIFDKLIKKNELFSSYGLFRLLAKAMLFVLIFLVAFGTRGAFSLLLLYGAAFLSVSLVLAIKSLLTSFFSYSSFVFDHAFDEGELISVDQTFGHVEQIGWARTRIRARTGELIILPNEMIEKTAVQNFSRLERRRAELCYRFPLKEDENKIASLIEHVRCEIESNKDCRFVCASSTIEPPFFKATIVYEVLTKDLLYYLDIKQAIMTCFFARLSPHLMPYSKAQINL